jgi:hypothetical protein
VKREVEAARGAGGGAGAAHGTGSEVPAIEEGYGGAIGQTVGLGEKRESKSSGGGSEEAKGKYDSSKMTLGDQQAIRGEI